MGKSTWPSDADKKLKKLFPFFSNEKVAKKLGRTPNAVEARAYRLQLKKHPDYLATLTQRKLFQKGQVSPNKGKPMLPHVLAAIRPHQFKAGLIPATTKPEGHEQLNSYGYTEIKVNGKWVYKQKVIWETHNKQKQPPKTVIIFNDGNKQNFSPQNLSCITMAQNMERNTITRFPKQLITTIKLLSHLKKKIHEKSGTNNGKPKPAAFQPDTEP